MDSWDFRTDFISCKSTTTRFISQKSNSWFRSKQRRRSTEDLTTMQIDGWVLIVGFKFKLSKVRLFSLWYEKYRVDSWTEKPNKSNQNFQSKPKVRKKFGPEFKTTDQFVEITFFDFFPRILTKNHEVFNKMALKSRPKTKPNRQVFLKKLQNYEPKFSKKCTNHQP